MKVIPVIDLQEGLVVHARQGQRERYRPIETPLCPGSDPFRVIEAFLSLHSFQTVYVADLDALKGKGHQASLLGELAAAFPGLHFWVDGGWPAAEGEWTPVVGTESLRGGHWAGLARQSRNWILSLDHFDGRYTGPAQVLAETARWPERVIVMCLNRVGGDQGPDWQRLQHVRDLAPTRWFAAAGGVRGKADLMRLEGMGIDGALVASALHDGRLAKFD